MAEPAAPQPPSAAGGRKPRKPKRLPPRFEPDPSGRYCDAHTKAPDHHLCDNPAGYKTDHLGLGRCHLHGGDSPIKSGRYSKINRTRLRDLIAEHAADRHPLNMLPDLAAMRALFQDYIERYDEWRDALLAWHESCLRGGDQARPHQILDVADAYRILAEVTKVVERIERIRAENAISRQDLVRIMGEMGNAVTLYVMASDLTPERRLEKIRDAWAGVRL